MKLQSGRSFGGDSGFTLSELLVGATVLSIFVMLALGTIVPAIKVTLEAEESIDSQRQVVLTFDRLIAEMSTADRGSLTVGSEAFSFLSSQEYRGTNSPIPDASLVDLGFATPDRVWRKTVVLARRENQVWRREFPYTHGRQLRQVLPERLETVAQTPGRQEKISAKNIELFEVSTAGSNRVLLRVRSVSRQAEKPAACELDLQVQMRGGM